MLKNFNFKLANFLHKVNLVNHVTNLTKHIKKYECVDLAWNDPLSLGNR